MLARYCDVSLKNRKPFSCCDSS